MRALPSAKFLITLLSHFMLFEPARAFGLWVVDNTSWDIMHSLGANLRWEGVTNPRHSFCGCVVSCALGWVVSNKEADNKMSSQ